MRVNPVCRQLENLTVELRTADAARAAEIVHQAAEWWVLAGFGQQAHDAYEFLLTAAFAAVCQQCARSQSGERPDAAVLRIGPSVSSAVHDLRVQP